VDCYYHHAVPSVAACVGCREPICATCRSSYGDCPGCRLAARIDAAQGGHELPGQVPPRPAAGGAPYGHAPQAEPSFSSAGRHVATVRPESRALVALSYPFWPLALLALLDSGRSAFVRRQAIQALGFNFGIYGLWFALSAIAMIPLIGFSAIPLLPLVVPVAVVASFVYAYKTWQGDDVRVPIVSDFIDNRPAMFDELR
jgi:uncharacterized membrane protein